MPGREEKEMLISKEEMKKRYELGRQIMKENHLEAIFLIGDYMPGDELSGDFQYFVNNYIMYRRHCVLMFPNQEPTLISGGWVQTENAKKNCWIDDCRAVGSDTEFFNKIADILVEKKIEKGAVGTNTYYVSMAIQQILKDKIPGISLVDVHRDIMRLRMHHSKGEMDIIRRCCEIADGAYEHIIPFIKPGITQNELRGELDNFMISKGAENTFTCVSTGVYSTDPSRNTLQLTHVPLADFKTVKENDTVWLEITPQFDGYWGQLVRLVSVSQQNDELEEVSQFVQAAIEAAEEEIRPGNTVGQMVRTMRKRFASYTDRYQIGSNVGHICGLDLTDAPIDDDSELEMVVGMAMIIHPSVLTPDGAGEVFFGETYMVTEDGCERLMKADYQISVVN